MDICKHIFKISFLLNIFLGLVLFVIPAYSKTLDFLIQADDVVRGDPKAPITLLEYSDFTCHFCKKFFHDTFPKLLSEYIETGKVRFVYRDFPRGFGSPLRTAKASRCAGEQNAYWPMHDRLFNGNGQFSHENLKQFAKEMHLNLGQFSQCLESKKHLPSIEKDHNDARLLRFTGTPGFALFLTQEPDEVKLIRIHGAHPYETFKEEIDKLLNLHSTSDGEPSPSS